jgi:hypothetical protein
MAQLPVVIKLTPAQRTLVREASGKNVLTLGIEREAHRRGRGTHSGLSLPRASSQGSVPLRVAPMPRHHECP